MINVQKHSDGAISLKLTIFQSVILYNCKVVKFQGTLSFAIKGERMNNFVTLVLLVLT